MDILIALFGRFHPMLVHFPIALLVVATGLRLGALTLKRPALNAGTRGLVYLAAASAVLSAGAGLALAAGDTWHGSSADTLERHKWLALAGTLIAVVAAALERARPQKENDVMNAVLLVVSTGLIAAGAHLGGSLVFGDDHFSSAFAAQEAPEVAAADPVKDEKAPEKKAPEKKAPEKKAPDEKKAQAKVDFKTQIEPIFEKSCLKCHGVKKKKGDLRLDKREYALKGGESGEPAILPGKGAESHLYKLITLPEDHEDVMPAKGDLLTKEQQELIRRWIDEGAHWSK